ncbi:MAG: metallophosphoesterase N-terminal domain-containing protein, partial [Planctomycetota bacterium]|nr:metallophosphoesterase N-terminal domain-containing protein [Planctomycetota bacterium]
MSRREFLAIVSIVLAAGLAGGADVLLAATNTDTIHGHVTCGGKALADVLVSDGYGVVHTDKTGRYELRIGPHSGRFVADTTSLDSGPHTIEARVTWPDGTLVVEKKTFTVDETDPLQALIRQAGNVEDDDARLEILKQLQAQPGLDARLQADVDRMVALVDRWQHDKSLWNWYQREIRKTVDYEFGIEETSPLAPLASLYRGRMLFWVTNEYGNIIGYHKERRKFLDKAVEEFRIAAAAFPKNRIIRMYLGKAIPCEKEYPGVHGAPQWAVYQRENLERLTDIVEWWIDNRLRKNGEYGGAWDDDCEMWRHWVPVMIAFEHPKITQAQAFFSNALLSQDYMRGGYTKHVYDVEHTAEPTTDTITPMMHLAPDDPAWKKRALRLAELMETLWTGRNERGQLQFKSTYFNADRVDPDPIRACDTPYHVVAVPPALLLWQRTGDKKLGALFSAWMDTWVDATARAEHGKPPGVIPAAIHWPDGDCKGPGKDWWDPRHHDEPKLYLWPAAMSKMTDTLLLTYHMSGDEKYLEPLRSMAALRLAWLKDRPQ